MNEKDRIEKIYIEREGGDDVKYSLRSSYGLFSHQSKVRALRDVLESEKLLNTAADLKLLEVGCGKGGWFRVFEGFGFNLKNLSGIDLVEKYIETAKVIFPDVSLKTGDGTKLPWDNNTFDVVFQATVFSSILKTETKMELAAEMKRVCKSGGYIIWYDFIYNNPKNRDVRGVTVREIESLFSCGTKGVKTTLAPPIARKLVSASWGLASALENFIPILRTHYMAAIRIDKSEAT